MNIVRACAALLVGVLCGVIGSAQSSVQLFPARDTAGRLQGLAEVVTLLERAAQHRSASELAELLAEPVTIGGRSATRQDAISILLSRYGEPDVFWDFLQAAVAMGPSVGPQNRVVIPYFIEGPLVRVASGSCVSTGAAIVVRAEPSNEASMVATLNYSVVRARRSPAAPRWLEVSLEDGKRGFVRLRECALAEGVRLYLDGKGNRWSVSSIASGP